MSNPLKHLPDPFIGQLEACIDLISGRLVRVHFFYIGIQHPGWYVISESALPKITQSDDSPRRVVVDDIDLAREYPHGGIFYHLRTRRGSTLVDLEELPVTLNRYRYRSLRNLREQLIYREIIPE